MALKEILLLSVLGMAIVFFGLVLLMLVIRILSTFSKAKNTKADAKTPAPAPQAAPAPAPVAPAPVVPAAAPVIPAAPFSVAPMAPGSAGEIKLYTVEPRTAAMLMAIIADQLQMPLETLRFKSVRCLDDEI